MEAPARIELATLRLGNECSIHLSYGAVVHKLYTLGRFGWPNYHNLPQTSPS